MAERAFKVCPCCGQVWLTRDDFLADPRLFLDGYQADFGKLEKGLFYFTHRREGCGSTMVLFAFHFLDLYTGPRHPESKTLSAECPRYCVFQDQISRCHLMCEKAFVREVLHIVQTRLEAARARPIAAAA